MRLHLLLPFLLLVGIVGACSDANTAVDGGAGGSAGVAGSAGVGGSDAAPADVPPSNEASGDAGVLSETSRTTSDGGICVLPTPPPDCKPTYAEELARGCQQNTDPRSGTCGELLAVNSGGGFTASVCYYDSSSRTLVAEFFCNDYNAYCNGQAFCFLAGGDVGACLDHRTIAFSPVACLPGDGGVSDMAGP